MREYKFIDVPQKAIVVDNYCENYEELTNNFPDIDVVGHKVRRCNFLSDSFTYDKNIWDPFIKKHLSREYFEEICLMIEDHLMEWRPKLLKKIKNGNYTLTVKDPKVDYSIVEHEILCYFKFSYGVDRISTEQHGLADIFNDKKFFSDKGIPVHVDSQNNIFQTMIYFPESEDTGSGGDIHFTNLHKDGTLFDVVKCRYTKNRALIFPHHPSGWHFVTSRKSNFPRRIVGIIFSVNDNLQEIPPNFFSQYK